MEELGLPLDERGRVLVDSSFRVSGRSNVWALGDCAAVPNAATPTSSTPTCQHALRQARRLAANLRGDERPYGYRMIGQGATLGRDKGIANLFGRFNFRGGPGASFTRMYHLYQLPLSSRRLRVVADGMLSMAFGRDMADLGLLERSLGDSSTPCREDRGLEREAAGSSRRPPPTTRLQPRSSAGAGRPSPSSAVAEPSGRARGPTATGCRLAARPALGAPATGGRARRTARGAGSRGAAPVRRGSCGRGSRVCVREPVRPRLRRPHDGLLLEREHEPLARRQAVPPIADAPFARQLRGAHARRRRG